MGIHAGKIVLITGASRGIGRTAAEHFAREGAHVVAAARNATMLRELTAVVAETPGECRPYPIDLADLEAVGRLASVLSSDYGRLDVLIGNAGVFPGHLLVHDVSVAAMQETLQLNFISNWRLLACCHPLLRTSNAGRVIFISSSNAYGGFPEWSAYAASKAALDRVMAAYAAENENSAIRCNSLSPGPVATDMGLHANKGAVDGMVSAEAIMPLFDLLTSADLKHTGKMFEFRHFGGRQPLEVWSMRRY